MNGMIIHTATVVTEMKGLTSCGEARRLIERDMTPELRGRVLAQEARWEAFERAAWEGEDEPEDDRPDDPECEGCDCLDGCEGCVAWELDESMDGDHASALASAGFGTDEDYGSFGGDDW